MTMKLKERREEDDQASNSTAQSEEVKGPYDDWQLEPIDPSVIPPPIPTTFEEALRWFIKMRRVPLKLRDSNPRIRPLTKQQPNNCHVRDVTRKFMSKKKDGGEQSSSDDDDSDSSCSETEVGFAFCNFMDETPDDVPTLEVVERVETEVATSCVAKPIQPPPPPNNPRRCPKMEGFQPPPPPPPPPLGPPFYRPPSAASRPVMPPPPPPFNRPRGRPIVVPPISIPEMGKARLVPFPYSVAVAVALENPRTAPRTIEHLRSRIQPLHKIPPPPRPH
eukprot:Platyproteum_vivax@DN3874_c0_g1_i1.p1